MLKTITSCKNLLRFFVFLSLFSKINISFATYPTEKLAKLSIINPIIPEIKGISLLMLKVAFLPTSIANLNSTLELIFVIVNKF